MCEYSHLHANVKPPHCWLTLYPLSGSGFPPPTDAQIACFPRGKESGVFVWTEIPRDPPSFGVMDTYKGVGNYKYRALINRREGSVRRLDYGGRLWICALLRCLPWAPVSVPMTCSVSLVPAAFLQVQHDSSGLVKPQYKAAGPLKC